MMKNRDLYLKDPTKQKLVNEGVANVNDDRNQQAMDVLRYELETFVCEGQYEKGMAHIFDTFLRNIDQAQQPAVWVSGFYGSGKSHLVKMLRALWNDTVFADGATARGIANLPQSIRDSLRELTTQAKRHGGLHSSSGTLGASASGSVRLALLRILFKSVDLPELYPVARFVMWLRQEGIEAQIRDEIVQNGYDWEEELDNFYVAEGLHAALVKVKPNLFSSQASCVETLNNRYPYVADISSDEMVKTMRLALTHDGKFPLTLIVLDEIQQFIGEDSQRSIDVQEVVESCSKSFGGKLLFIGTGQTAVTGTSNLKKLEGRFTIRVELSDADVESVIRQVILAKKPEVKAEIGQVMQTNLGEISRHLSGTTIGHRQQDIACFPQDYPILPVRRRFWENALRVLDQTGTDSQLRNQLSMIHKVIQTNLDAPLGHTVPADYLYFDAADKLLQARLLPRRVHEKTMSWIKGTPDEQLMARSCGLVFLINKLASQNNEIGIHANANTLADLLLEDISKGSSGLRSRLPTLLDSCELLIKVGDEYRILTEESAAWNDEFRNQQSVLMNEAHRVEVERNDRIRKYAGEAIRKLSLVQGNSKVSREVAPIYDSHLPMDANERVYLWVRDGWSVDENSVRADARQAGNTSPTVFVFIPKRSADGLRHHLIDFKAALATLDKRGVPTTPEGTEARAAMETIKQTAEQKINELIEEAFSGVRVFQGGGSEIAGGSLREMVLEAAENALTRLYPQFHTADHAGWANVYAKAQKGSPDALKSVGDDGEPVKNPVCKGILGYIAGGKRGSDIRAQFEGAPYGWSGDAVDGSIQVLLVNGILKALDDRSQLIEPKTLERKAIGKTLFKVESANVTVLQRLQIRKLMQKAEVPVKPNEELAGVQKLLEKLKGLAEKAGGEAPKPERPDISVIEEIQASTGNEQLLAIFNQVDTLMSSIDQWSGLADKIAQRWPNWMLLAQLSSHANGLQDADILRSQMDTIKKHRQLLDEPDPVLPILNGMAQMLREQLNLLDAQYAGLHTKGMDHLSQNANWNHLEPEQRNQLLSEQSLTIPDRPSISVQSNQDVLETLDKCSLAMFEDKVAAMPGRFDNVSKGAAKLCEPKVQFFHVPSRTLKDESDLSTWLTEVEEQLREALAEGPVNVS